MLVIAITMQSIQDVRFCCICISFERKIIIKKKEPIVNKWVTLPYFFQSLPRTPYYKLIDVWMMFSLTILLYALVCNTIIGCFLEQAKSLEKSHTDVLRIEPTFQSRQCLVNVDEEFKTLNERNLSQRSTVDYRGLAFTLNKFGKWVFAISVLFFNVVFWAYSIYHYIDQVHKNIHLHHTLNFELNQTPLY